MKIIKYDLNGYTVEMPWTEANEEIVKAEADNGEYVVEDNRQSDPANIPVQIDVIEAQVAYTAMMTDTLMGV